MSKELNWDDKDFDFRNSQYVTDGEGGARGAKERHLYYPSLFALFGGHSARVNMHPEINFAFPALLSPPEPQPEAP
jgi:hypothetical protein